MYMSLLLCEIGADGPAGDKPARRDMFIPLSLGNGESSPAPGSEFLPLCISGLRSCIPVDLVTGSVIPHHQSPKVLRR